MSRPCSLIVDGSNLLCRAAFALSKLTLSDDDATPCGGAWGLLNSLVTAMEKTGADEIHVCWDGGRSGRRLELLPSYKGNRGPSDGTPDEKMQQVWAQANLVDPVLRAAGAWTYRWDGVEADDTIALLALSTTARNRDAVIVSNDADFMQLVGEKWGDGEVMVYVDKSDRLWQAGKCRPALIGTAALTTKCLCGCSSDNIPGIAGIGDTRATALRESVLADEARWDIGTLREIARGRYYPPGYGMKEHRNVTKAVDLLKQDGGEAAIQILTRNVQLVDLMQSATGWPEVGEAALHPTYHENPGEEALGAELVNLDWKPERFRPLLGAGA